jgi:NADPH:quinone reductase-like Zn-dependent oxidoreductase
MLQPHGGFAEFSVQKANALVAHPKVDSVIAAATPCAGWTAWRALFDKLRAPEATSILITGASGGVGGFAVQLAKYLNYQRIIGTCSTKNFNYVRDLGATDLIDYRTDDVVGLAREITNQQGVGYGIDTVGAGNDLLVANSLAYEGQMVGIVNTLTPALYDSSFGKGLSFHQLSLGSGHRNGQRGLKDLINAGNQFSSLLEKGSVRAPKIRTVELGDMVEALQDISSQRTVGKVVVKFS